MANGDLVSLDVELWAGGAWVEVLSFAPLVAEAGLSVRSSGRADWSSQVSPGSITLTLDNTSGWLSPGAAPPFSGAWSPGDFAVGAQLRVRANWGGAWVPLGTGEIVSLSYRWPSGDHGGPSFVDVEVAGLLSRLRRDKGQVLSPLTRGLRSVVLPKDSPFEDRPWTVAAHWPMEGDGRDVVGGFPGVSPMTFTAGTSFSGGDLPGSAPVLTFPAGDPAGFRVAGPWTMPVDLYSGWAVTMLVKVGDISGLAAGNTELLTVGMAGEPTLVRLWLRNNGILRCSASDGINTVENPTFNGTPMPSGEWCVVHVSCGFVGPPFANTLDWGWFPVSGGDGDKWWMDPMDFGVFLTPTVRAISRMGRRDLNVRTDFSIGHLALFTGDWAPNVSTDELAPIFRPLANAHVGEQARARIERVAAEAATFGPALDIDCLPSSPEMDTARCGPQSIAASIDIVENAAEVGQAMLIERAAESGLDCVFPEAWYNADPSVSLDAEADEISIPFALTLDIQTDNDGSSADTADEWSADNLNSWLDYLAESPLKSPTVTVTDWPGDFAGGAPGDIFEVTNLPAAQLIERDMVFRAEQITHTLTRGKWVSTINTSSAEPWRQVGVWDETEVRVDVGSGLLGTDITAAQTSIHVYTDVGPRWMHSTDPQWSSFDIQIDDEIMTVTASVDAGPPAHTFTVVRGARGTTPAEHAFLARVRVAPYPIPPAYWAY